MTSLSLHSMTVKTSGISIIPTSPECTIYTRPKVLSGHLKITIHFSYKHALSHLLSYHVKYDDKGPKSCQFRYVHCHFILPLKCYNGSDVHRKRDRAVAWCKQGISLDRLAIHLTINTAPSEGIHHAVQTTN